MIPISSW